MTCILKYSVFFIAATLVLSCSKEVSFEQDTINLNATVLPSGYSSKAAAVAQAYKDSIPSSGSPLNADVWFSTTAHTFKGTGGISVDGRTIDVHNTISYIGPYSTSPAPIDGKYLHYPPNNGSVYCVGLYPQGAWSVEDSATGTSAVATIDGIKDLMYASEMSGNAANTLNKSNQEFQHQLTWIKVTIRTDSHETVDTWGKLEEISIKTEKQAKVDFTTGEVTFNNINPQGDSLIAYEGNDKVPYGSTEIGSIMVAPTSAGKYYVSVKCSAHQRYNVEVPLTDNDGRKYTGSSKGKVFVLTLYFKKLATAGFSATLSEFTDSGSVIELE